jgi:hypothetical protein
VSFESPTEPDWEILNLLREVRKRARASGGQTFLARLHEEPRWLSALPATEARLARTMLEATREMARRAADPLGTPAPAVPEHAPARPRRSGRRRAR